MLSQLELGISGQAMEGINQVQDMENFGETILGHYEQLTKARNQRRGAALTADNLSLRMKPVSLINSPWNTEDVFAFRHALIDVVVHWDNISSTPCPIHFSELELESHRMEKELREELKDVLHILEAEHMIPLGGMVRPEYYEQAQETSKHFKEQFVSRGKDESQRALRSNLWPYQDRHRD
jgi:hypothetical protein